MPQVGGSYTYDPTVTSGTLAPVYQLRQIVPDSDFTRLPGDSSGPPTVLFSDQEYLNFLTWNQGDPIYALVQALLTIANNRALMAIHVNLGGGGEVDWATTPRELRAQAQAIREYYESIPAEAFADVDYTSTSWQRIITRRILQGLP